MIRLNSILFKSTGNLFRVQRCAFSSLSYLKELETREYKTLDGLRTEIEGLRETLKSGKDLKELTASVEIGKEYFIAVNHELQKHRSRAPISSYILALNEYVMAIEDPKEMNEVFEKYGYITSIGRI